MRIQHTTPCRECPWLRASAAGWLGGNTVEQYAAPVRAGVLVPCHLASHRAYCAGAAITMRNSCTLPRDPTMAAEVKKVERSETVFRFVGEFEAHHTRSSGRMTMPSKLPPFPLGLIPALRALRAACDDPNIWWCKTGEFVARRALPVEKESHRSLANLRTAADYGFAEWLKVGNSFRWRITAKGRRALKENGYG